MSKSLKFYLLSNTSNSVRKYHFQNFTDDLLTIKPPFISELERFFTLLSTRFITQQELSFVMHEIISKDRYNQANSVTHKYSFSIQHCHHSINRNFARPFPSSQQELRSAFSEHRSAFSVESFIHNLRGKGRTMFRLCRLYEELDEEFR